MFDQLRQLRKLKKQMDAMEIEETSGGVTVRMNGSMQVLSVTVADREDRNLEKNIMNAVNSSVKTIQKRMAKDMMASGQKLF